MSFRIKSLQNLGFMISRQNTNKEKRDRPCLSRETSQKAKTGFLKLDTVSFCGKGMQRLNKMLREERHNERVLQKKQAERKLRRKLQEEKINKPLPPEIEAMLDFSDSAISKGRKKALSIGYNLRNDKNESLYILNNEGDILASAIGNEHAVATFHNPDYDGCLSVHNHPNNSPFSPGVVFGDVITMIRQKLGEMTVTVSEGFYTMSRTPETDFNKTYNALVGVDKKYESYRRKLISNKKITEEGGNKHLFNYLDGQWHGFAKTTGMKYEFKKWA